MPQRPVDPARLQRRAALRRATLHLILAICALDGVALALYFLGGIARSDTRTRMIFTVTWTIATALVVAVLLKRVRLARNDVGR